MDFKAYILKYLDAVNYTEWSLLGVLNYLAENVSYASAALVLEEITKTFGDLLESRSKNNAYLRSVQKKAEKLYTRLDSMKCQPEIQQFLKNIDLEHAHVSHKILINKIQRLTCALFIELYGTDVELSIVADKSATVVLSTKKYLAVSMSPHLWIY